MKPFYGIDRTTQKKSTRREGECFIAQSVSGITAGALNQAAKTAEGQQTRAKLPAPLNILRAATGFTTLLLFFSLIRSMRRVTLAEAYENAPFIFWILGGSAVIWGVLSLFAFAIGRKVRSTDEYATAERRLEGAVQNAYRELGVPQDAKDVDVIAISYKWKNGKMKPVAYGMETSERHNIPFKVFRREDRLCLANTEHRYELPLAEIKALRSVKKAIYAQGWNKDEQFDMGFYKPYKLTRDQYGRIHMRYHGILVLEHEGVEWGVWLPPYELNYISALTGIAVTEE